MGANLLSAAQLNAVKLMGQKDVVRRGVRLTEPAYGRKAIRALLNIGYVQDDAAMQRVLREAGVKKSVADEFRRNKRVVRHVESTGLLEVVPNIPGLADDSLSEYADTEVVFGEQDVPVIEERPMKYKLNHIFNDVTLVDKLRLSPRRMQALKRLAVSNPAEAAASLTDYLKSRGFPNTTVTAGDYARSIGRMRDVIRQHADSIQYKDTAAPAIITPSEIFMTFDGFELRKPLWTVRGPVKYATEVQAIYQLAIHYGPDHLLFLLGIETVFLRINILNEETGIYFDGSLEGYSSLHGISPRDPSLPSELTVEQQTRLCEAATKVEPVWIDGMVTGTAIHVSDKHWILNEHTLTHAADADKVPELLSEPIQQWRSVGNDIAMVKRDQGAPAKWLLRRADVGERVVLCFSVGKHVEYSEVLRVQSVVGDQLMLSDSAVMRKGASGAVAVALRDSALLGIFSTIKNSSVVCSIFDSASFVNVTDLESVMSSELATTPGVAVGNITYDKMVRRGLQGFLEGIDQATTALYATHGAMRQQVGLVACASDIWQTTVNPDVEQLTVGNSMPLAFRNDGHGRYTVVAPPLFLKPVPNVRTVVPGERVFLFTKFNTDVAMTSVKIVTHCWSDMHTFIVEDFGDSEILLDGGLIVAEKDAAVVGQFLTRDLDAYGEPVIKCVAFGSQAVVENRAHVNSTSLVADLYRWSNASGDTLDGLSVMGQSVIKLAGEQFAFRTGIAMHEGVTHVTYMWEDGYDHIVHELGMQAVDRALFEKHSPRILADAFIALVYMFDPGGFEQKLRPFILDQTQGRTPVVGEFPFVRPLSTGSIGSRGTRVEHDSSTDRIRDLEDRFEQLVQQLAVSRSE